MIGFRRIERHCRYYLRNDGGIERVRGGELLQIGVGELALLRIFYPDHAPVLRSLIWSLIVELGRICRDGDEYTQQRSVADDGGIVGDLQGFCVPGGSRADDLVLRGARGTAGI